MNEDDRFYALEGKVAALELIVPMIAAHLIPNRSPIRENLAEYMETIAAGYGFPSHRPKVFVEAFSGCFDEIAANHRKSP